MPRTDRQVYIQISRSSVMAQQPKFSKAEFKGKAKSCPRCNATAKGLAEIDQVFGLRNSGGHVIAQSLCRLCRSAHAREVREFKASNKKLQTKNGVVVDLRSYKVGKGKKATLVRASTGKKLSHKVKTKAKKISKVTKKVTKKIKSKKSKKKN